VSRMVPARSGRVAQWESARFTRERSQVRNPPRPFFEGPAYGRDLVPTRHRADRFAGAARPLCCPLLPARAEAATPEPDSNGPTRESVREAAEALTALVEKRLPENFYVRGEPMWRLGATALIARMVGIVDSVMRLMAAERPSDTALLIRALYEYAVTLCWLLIDPTKRLQQWADHAVRERAKLHRDASRFDIES
jgi:hypothetical protein